MKSVLSVKMLSALALVLLVSSATEGRILSKCELKAQLEAGLGGNQGGSGPGSVTSGVGVVTGGVVGNGTGSVTSGVGVVTGGVVGNGTGSVTSGVGDVTGGVVGNGTGSVTSGVGVVTGGVVGNGTGSLPGIVPGNGTAPGNGTVDLGLIAKIVCSVERVSKFNTNLVTAIGSPADSRPRPAQRPNERPGGRPGQGRPGGRGKRSPGGGRDRNPHSLFGDSSEEDSSENTRVSTKLFGIFQLSDQVACNSGSGQSLNICRIDCSALIDDDIRDDITCLKKLLDSVTNAPAPVFAPRPKKKHMLYVKECRNVNPLLYFAACV